MNTDTITDGQVMGGAILIGIPLAVVVAIVSYLLAPPIPLPGGWEQWGRLGIAAAAGWFTLVLSIALGVFITVAKGFHEFGKRQRDRRR